MIKLDPKEIKMPSVVAEGTDPDDVEVRKHRGEALDLGGTPSVIRVRKVVSTKTGKVSYIAEPGRSAAILRAYQQEDRDSIAATVSAEYKNPEDREALTEAIKNLHADMIDAALAREEQAARERLEKKRKAKREGPQHIVMTPPKKREMVFTDKHDNLKAAHRVLGREWKGIIGWRLSDWTEFYEELKRETADMVNLEDGVLECLELIEAQLELVMPDIYHPDPKIAAAAVDGRVLVDTGKGDGPVGETLE